MGARPLRVVLAGVAGQDADDRGDDADRGDEQREDHADRAEDGLPEDQGGHQRHRVGLEEVGGHAGAVADVVAHVVGDGGGVARVVLGDARLDLADQVGADVGGLGEDAAADTHEHGEQGAAEAEALEDDRRVLVEDQQHERGAEQAQADGDHAADATGAVRDAEGRPVAAGAGGLGHADVGAGGQRHADEADERGERRTDQEEDRPAEPGAPAAVVHRQQEQQDEDDHGEDAEGAELPTQIGRRSLLHRLRDLAHLRRPLVGGQDGLDEERGEAEGSQRDGEDDDDQRHVPAGQRTVGHVVLQACSAAGASVPRVGEVPPRCRLNASGTRAV